MESPGRVIEFPHQTSPVWNENGEVCVGYLSSCHNLGDRANLFKGRFHVFRRLRPPGKCVRVEESSNMVVGKSYNIGAHGGVQYRRELKPGVGGRLLRCTVTSERKDTRSLNLDLRMTLDLKLRYCSELCFHSTYSKPESSDTS